MVRSPPLMTPSIPSVFTLLLASFSLAGCADLFPKEPPPFKARIVVESDPGKPLANVPVSLKGQPLANTGADGSTVVTLNGRDGDTADLVVRCPDGTAPKGGKSSVHLVIRHFEEAHVTEHKLQCAPSIRKVLVAVRAEGGGGMPVMYLGRVIATTDAAGAAVAVIEARPGDTVYITLDTSSKPGLRPQNPHEERVVPEADSVLGLDVKLAEVGAEFVSIKPAVKPGGGHGSKAGGHGPKPVGPHRIIRVKP